MDPFNNKNDKEWPNNEQNQNVGHQINPGTIILSWLTYAFWGWTILAMSVLTLYEHDAGRQC